MPFGGRPPLPESSSGRTARSCRRSPCTPTPRSSPGLLLRAQTRLLVLVVVLVVASLQYPRGERSSTPPRTQTRLLLLVVVLVVASLQYPRGERSSIPPRTQTRLLLWFAFCSDFNEA